MLLIIKMINKQKLCANQNKKFCPFVILYIESFKNFTFKKKK